MTRAGTPPLYLYHRLIQPGESVSLEHSDFEEQQENSGKQDEEEDGKFENDSPCDDAHSKYTLPESGCLHQQADWVRLRPEPEMGTRRLISGTGGKMLKGARRVEDVGKQTQSDPMETVRPGKSQSDSPEVSSRETEKIALSHEAKQARYTWNIRRS